MKRHDNSEINDRIKKVYNCERPEYSFICDGIRKIFVNPDDQRAKSVLLSKGIKYYSKVPFFIFYCLRFIKFDIFLDIGSNYGECLLSVPNYNNTIIKGYEANPYLLTYLNKSIKYNFDLKNIFVYNIAISDISKQEIMLYIDPYWSGKSSAAYELKDNSLKHKVRTTTIDDEVFKENLSKTILIKIDIQGMEPKAIAGASRTNKELKNIVYIIEYDEKQIEKANYDYIDFINSLYKTFRIYKLTPRGIFEISSYGELRNIHPGEESKPKSNYLHIDLILVKFQDYKIENIFNDHFIKKDFYDIWQKVGYSL